MIANVIVNLGIKWSALGVDGIWYKFSALVASVRR